MNHTSPSDELNLMIQSLRERRKNEFMVLRQQLRLTGESLKPVNLIKSSIHDLAADNQVKSYLIKTAVGLAIGFLVKKIITSSGSKPKENWVEKLIDVGTNKLNAGHINLIKMAAPIIFGFIVKKFRDRKKRQEHVVETEY